MKTRTNQPVFLDNGEKVDDSNLGGTKLYRHSIDINNGDLVFVIISHLSNPISSFNDLMTMLEESNALSITKSSSGSTLLYDDDNTFFYTYRGEWQSIDLMQYEEGVYVDTVTPL